MASKQVQPFDSDATIGQSHDSIYVITAQRCQYALMHWRQPNRSNITGDICTTVNRPLLAAIGHKGRDSGAFSKRSSGRMESGVGLSAFVALTEEFQALPASVPPLRSLWTCIASTCGCPLPPPLGDPEPPGPVLRFPHHITWSTLQTSLLCVKHCRCGRGKDAQGQKQHL